MSLFSETVSDESRIRSKTLMILSLALAIIILTDLEISEINLLGNKAKIEKSTVALWVIWLVWAYFLWKHWQAHITSSVRLKYGYIDYLNRTLARRTFDNLDQERKDSWKQHGLQLDLGSAKVKTNLFNATCDFFPQSNRQEVPNDVVLVRIGFSRLQWVRTKSLFRILVAEPKYTDVWFPYVFAAATLILGILDLFYNYVARL